ncbi:hypothetical protein BJ138DRAFT_1120119 [Hygrophoropsis aurantiaca]|uniref:Uncharacterized protein n=1 Tax=Hygrophoropsis aurantiaca TaxID=72124 RepID=A0ACB7ZS79_9AGAM|nr:hypothetical protein BJ138DRAFT_1120119 [Hygrophoropsis aurantiaca]
MPRQSHQKPQPAVDINAPRQLRTRKTSTVAVPAPKPLKTKVPTKRVTKTYAAVVTDRELSAKEDKSVIDAPIRGSTTASSNEQSVPEVPITKIGPPTGVARSKGSFKARTTSNHAFPFVSTAPIANAKNKTMVQNGTLCPVHMLASLRRLSVSSRLWVLNETFPNDPPSTYSSTAFHSSQTPPSDTPSFGRPAVVGQPW